MKEVEIDLNTVKNCWISKLFNRLYKEPELHVPSSKMQHYRNKITYNLPLVFEPKQQLQCSSSIDGADGGVGRICTSLSPLAYSHLNDICRAVHDWAFVQQQQLQQQKRIKDLLVVVEEGELDSNGIDTQQPQQQQEEPYYIFREVMVKSVRDGSTVLRVTVQRRQQQQPSTTIYSNCTSTPNANKTTESANDWNSKNNNWNETQQQSFHTHMTNLFPTTLTCICYNETFDRSRPTKESPLTILYGGQQQQPRQRQQQEEDSGSRRSNSTNSTTTSTSEYLMETIPHTQLRYRISPVTFCEVNHEVETLQAGQVIHWIQQQAAHQQQQRREREGADDDDNNDGGGSILVVSGRDISCFGLGFGSLTTPTTTTSNTANTTSTITTHKKIFHEVIAIQHCPLVHTDALTNYQSHSSIIQGTVLHATKDTMVSSISVALDSALQRQRQKHRRCISGGAGVGVTVVTSGGRKGLNPKYRRFLQSHPAIDCIIYNSCCTKSLLVDMKAFLEGPPPNDEGGGSEGGDGVFLYVVDDFRSYDFFPGTAYKASLIRLVRRRPRVGGVLVLPIGPAGVGKSTVSKTLFDYHHGTTGNNRCSGGSSRRICRWWQRDEVFKRMKDEGMSMGKSKTEVHRRLLRFLRGSSEDEDEDDGGGGDDEDGGRRDDEDELIRIVDSTNGNAEARLLYVEESQSMLVILVELRPFTSVTTTTTTDNTENTTRNEKNEGGIEEKEDSNIMNFLLERTRYRLGDVKCDDDDGGVDTTSRSVVTHHPSFPQTVKGQRDKHAKIIKGIQYPSPTELEAMAGRGRKGCDGNTSARRAVVHLRCDPSDEASLSSLPFEIFVVYSTNEGRLRELLVESWCR